MCFCVFSGVYRDLIVIVVYDDNDVAKVNSSPTLNVTAVAF